MESIERLQNALKGERVDRPPFSFWHHFGLQHMSGESVAAVHIAFARRFNVDFVKVMNDYPFPVREGLSMDRMTDVLQLQVLHGNEGSWSHQLLALKNIHTALGKEKWIVDTVYSPWTVLCRLFGIETMHKMVGSRPELVRQGMEVLTVSLVNYVNEARQYINGIYFSMTEADYDYLDPIQHSQICFPYNMRILEAAAGLPFNIVRLKGHRAFFESVKDYPSAAVSWEHFRTKTGLAKGLIAWQRSVLGGIDGDSFHLHSTAAIKQVLEKYSPEFLLPGLIIAPTRSLRTNVSPYLLEAIADGIEGLTKFNQGRPSSARELSRYPSMEIELDTPNRDRSGFARITREQRDAAREAIAEKSQKATNLQALAQANLDNALDKELEEETHIVEIENVNTAEVANDNKDIATVNDVDLPTDVDLKDIDDIFADDFEVFEEDDHAGVRGSSADSADDKPRQAWKNRDRERSSDRRDVKRGRDSRGGSGNRDHRGDGYGRRDSRSASGNRERRNDGHGRQGYDSRRDSRDESRGYSERQGGYGERREYGNRERSDYGNRERSNRGERRGYDSRSTRDLANENGSRDRRSGGYGRRDSRSASGNHERRGGGYGGGNRRQSGDRERGRSGYGERRGGYNGNSERSEDSNRRVIRINR